MAELKGNLYQPYLETRFAFPSRPDAAQPGSMTPEDARELEQYAASLFVTVVPAINVFGHMELLLAKKAYAHLREDPKNPFALCPLHPETRPLIKDLLNDIMDAFQSPLIHAGFDEVEPFGTCPRCRKKPPEKLMLDHITFAHKIITGRGRQMMVWHDKLLCRMEFAGNKALGHQDWADKVLNKMPRDIIICDWQYDATSDTTSHFTSKGFNAFACNADMGPMFLNYPLDFDSIWHASRHFAQAKRCGATGTIHTTWGDRSRERRDAFVNRWIFYLHSLSFSWQPAQRIKIRETTAHWARAEMGIDGQAYEEVVALLSIPLFGGTGKTFITRRGNKSRRNTFPFASEWWDAMGPRLLNKEKAFIDNLYERVAALRENVRRNGDCLDLLDYPITIRLASWDEVRCVGEAARLYKSVRSKRTTATQQKRALKRAARLLREHTRIIDLVLGALEKVHEAEGLAKEAFTKEKQHKRLILEMAAKLESKGKLKPFNQIFWDESEDMFNR